MALSDYINRARESQDMQKHNRETCIRNFSSFLQEVISKHIENHVNFVYDYICRNLAELIANSPNRSITFDYKFEYTIQLFRGMEGLFMPWTQKFSENYGYAWDSSIASKYGIIEVDQFDEKVPAIPLITGDPKYKKTAHWNTFFNQLKRKLSEDNIRVEVRCLREPYKKQGFLHQSKYLPLEQGQRGRVDTLFNNSYFDSPILTIYYN
ncbi:MAG: hypothetical protein IKW00_07590 [Clostridia bacterium]|nr:hypothetical protein [Clostridia bacterium]